jgi:UDP-2,3-diacylglucosamine hydrolase
MTDARCLFISDLHLEQDARALNAAFARFLQRESRRSDEIYILGDLVEVWVGDDDDAPFADWLRRLLESTSAHCDLYVMHGNRDFLFGNAFAAQCGARLLDDPTMVERNGYRILLAHGDAFCTADLSYQQMRALVRSSQWQSEILGRDLATRRSMARELRRQSAEANANKAENIMDVTPSEIEAAARVYRADVIVHGHTHRPAIHDHRIDERRLRRFVLGDWGRCGWSLRCDGADFSLTRFRLDDART